MIIHLAIIGGILVVGGILLFPQDSKLFEQNLDFDEAKGDLNEFTDETFNQVGSTLENTYDKVATTVDETLNKMG